MATKITQFDKYTVKDIDNAIACLDNKLKDKKISETTRNKVEALKERYILQKGKTFRLYDKNKRKHKALLGLNKTTLSVEKIYRAMGKNVVLDPNKNDKQGGWLWGSKSDVASNLITLSGLGIAIGGFMSKTYGTKTGWAHLGSAFESLFGFMKDNVFNNVASGFAAAGIGVAILGIAYKLISKKIKSGIEKRRIEANAELEAEQAADSDRVYDSESLSSNIDSLAEEASLGDPANNETYRHLEEILLSLDYGEPAKDAAREIIAKADLMRQSAKNYEQEYIVQKELLDENNVYSAYDTTTRKDVSKTAKEWFILKSKLDKAGQLDAASKETTVNTTTSDKYSGGTTVLKQNLSDFSQKLYNDGGSAVSFKDRVAKLETSAKSVDDLISAYVNPLPAGASDADKEAHDKAVKEVTAVYNAVQSEIKYEAFKTQANISGAPGSFKVGTVDADLINAGANAALCEAAERAGLTTFPKTVTISGTSKKWDKLKPSERADTYKLLANDLRLRHPEIMKKVNNHLAQIADKEMGA